jgi:hypothetical protein
MSHYDGPDDTPGICTRCGLYPPYSDCVEPKCPHSKKSTGAEPYRDSIIDDLASAQRQLAAQASEIAALREALKPFAKIHGYVCLKDEARCGIDFIRRIPKSRREEILTVADFRRARAAIAVREGGWGDHPDGYWVASSSDPAEAMRAKTLDECEVIIEEHINILRQNGGFGFSDLMHVQHKIHALKGNGASKP